MKHPCHNNCARPGGYDVRYYRMMFHLLFQIIPQIFFSFFFGSSLIFPPITWQVWRVNGCFHRVSVTHSGEICYLPSSAYMNWRTLTIDECHCDWYRRESMTSLLPWKHSQFCFLGLQVTHNNHGIQTHNLRMIEKHDFAWTSNLRN